jgi:hypothetical protein
LFYIPTGNLLLITVLRDPGCAENDRNHVFFHARRDGDGGETMSPGQMSPIDEGVDRASEPAFAIFNPSLATLMSNGS